MEAEPLIDLNQLARRIVIGLLAIELALVAVYWADVISGENIRLLHGLFDLDGEGNIPTWFSSAQLLLIGLAFWTLALRQPRGWFRSRPSRAFYTLAGCSAVYVSIDEAAQIHEQITVWLGRRYVDWLPGFAISHLWLTVLVLAGVFALYFLLGPDLLAIWHDHKRIAVVCVLGACIGLGGGMGVETIGYEVFHGERTSLWYKFEVTVEESMEMLGATLILISTLKLNFGLATKLTTAHVRVEQTAPSLISAAADLSLRS